MDNPLSNNYDISHSEMVTKLAKTGDVILAQLTPERCHFMHMVFGISGEAGEVMENYLEAHSSENYLEELGDTHFYITGLYTKLDTTAREELALLDHALLESWKQMYVEILPAIARFQVESATLLDIVKKLIIYDNADITHTDIFMQLRRVFTAAIVIEDMCGFTHVQVLDYNMDKLHTRYPNFEYSDSSAKARADKQEEYDDPQTCPHCLYDGGRHAVDCPLHPDNQQTS